MKPNKRRRVVDLTLRAPHLSKAERAELRALTKKARRDVDFDLDAAVAKGAQKHSKARERLKAVMLADTREINPTVPSRLHLMHRLRKTNEG